MNVIVTGSAGYIGGQIMLQLKDAGHTVYGIKRLYNYYLEGLWGLT